MGAEVNSTTTKPIEWLEYLNLIKFTHRHNNILALYILVQGHTGMRCSDVVDLRWGDFKKSEYKIYPQKTNLHKNVVTVYFSKKIKDYVQDNFIRKDGDYVFSVRDRGVKKLSFGNINKQMGTIIKKYNESYKKHLPNLTTHTWRKTFGKRFYEMLIRNEGKTAQEALTHTSYKLGHNNVQMTFAYIGLSEDFHRDIMRKYF